MKSFDGFTQVALASLPSLDLSPLGQARYNDNLLDEPSPFPLSGFEVEDEHLDDVPPFPSGHSPVVFLIRDHYPRSPAVPLAYSAFSNICEDGGTTHTVITAPTGPRMKMILKEKLFIKSWIDTLSTHDLPDHVPWCSSEEVLDPVRHITKPLLTSLVSSPASRGPLMKITYQHRPLSSPPEMQPCLETEHEMKLRGDGRLSLKEAVNKVHVMTGKPAISRQGNISPVVPNSNGEVFLYQNQGRSLPALVVSTSTAILPASVDSSPSRESSTPLATRRGRDILPLSFKSFNAKPDIDYPDIPTAFLGTPSAQSPNFGFTCNSDAPSQDHESMLASLRSMCSSLPHCMSPSVLETNCVRDHDSPRDSCPEVQEDDWAFSKILSAIPYTQPPLLKHDGPLVCSDGTSVESPKDKDEVDYLDLSGDTLCGSPPETPTAITSAALKAGNIPLFRISRPTRKSSLILSPPLGSPPSIPLPPRPTLISPALPKAKRGILKATKSVRFLAPLDDADDCIFGAADHPAPLPGLKRPSPLRNSHMAEDESVTRPSRLPETPANSKIVKNETTPLEVNTSVGSTEHNVSPLRLDKPGSSITGARKCHQFADASSGKHDKGDSRMSTPTPSIKLKRWSTSEKVSRRSSGIQTAQKSRMPTPLRNIFTRLK